MMRCLALAQYLHDAGTQCCLLTKPDGGAPIEQWRQEGFTVHLTSEKDPERDGAVTAELAGKIGASWVVADGYGFSLSFQRAIKCKGVKLLCFDDLADFPMIADVIVNPNMGSEERAHYDCPADTDVLLGSGYAMLRREFLKAAPCVSREAPHVLVTFGGEDRQNLALEAMKALDGIDWKFTATVVCSGTSGGLGSARAYGMTNPARWRVLGPAPNMALLMAEADLALCAGGTTALELAYVGVPMVIITLAANQVPGAKSLAEQGCAVLAGHGRESLARASQWVAALLSDDSRRKEMSLKGRIQVDGRGPERVAARLHNR
jgi:UDP-2,4-diacetamido-2,4,6-trideoxy-beta-L-altropyranose hydrolase